MSITVPTSNNVPPESIEKRGGGISTDVNPGVKFVVPKTSMARSHQGGKKPKSSLGIAAVTDLMTIQQPTESS